MRSKSRGRRRFPGPVTGLTVVALLGVVLVIRSFDVLGDQGLVNALTTVLVLLAGLILLGWFVLRSGWPARVRFGVLAGVVILVAAGLTLFRFEGVSGSMVPRFAFRFAAPVDVPALPAPSGGAADVDLSTTTPDDYPGFLGPGRDLGIDHVRLSRDWSERPELLWKRPVGAAWSAFSVVNGFAVTMEQRGEREVVTCYEAATGEPCWSYAMEGRYEDVIAGTGPRSTPTIAGGSVYALGATGTLVALDGRTGELRWEHDLLELSGMSREQERTLLPYGRANSPLVVDGLVVLPLGGPPDGRQAGLIAFRSADGEVAWRSPPRQLSMASPTLATLAGVRQILTVNEASVSGHDPASGALLWEHPWPGSSAGDANVSQPVPVPPDRVFLSKGYGGGAALLQLERAADGTLRAEELWHEPRVLRTKLTNVALNEGFVYGLSEGILECVDLDTGERVWKHGRYHHGQILRVGDLLLVLTEEGEVVLVEATPERPDNVLGRFQALEGPTWNNLALYGDLLLVRNAREAAAYRLPLAATE